VRVTPSHYGLGALVIMPTEQVARELWEVYSVPEKLKGSNRFASMLTSLLPVLL
jgi:hypothetical protein